MIKTLKSSLYEGDIKEFETIIKDMVSIPKDVENFIIVNDKTEFLNILIKYDKVSKDLEALSGCFTKRSQLAIKLKNNV